MPAGVEVSLESVNEALRQAQDDKLSVMPAGVEVSLESVNETLRQAQGDSQSLKCVTLHRDYMFFYKVTE